MRGAGVDLGARFAAVATLNDHQSPVLVPDVASPDQFRTPSAVYVNHGIALVGAPALGVLADNPAAAVWTDFKRAMGTDTEFVVGTQRWRAEGLTSLVLRKLACDAGAVSDGPVEHAVITVPAGSSDAVRRSAHTAAALAGFRQVRLVEDPVAIAAYAETATTPCDGPWLVCDAGAGAFSAAVIVRTAQTLQVASCESSAQTGGVSFDHVLARYFGDRFRHICGRPPTVANGAELARAAELFKHRLATPGQGSISQVVAWQDLSLHLTLNRSAYERLVAVVVENALAQCDSALQAAGQSWSSIRRIIVAGGGARMPWLTNRIRERAPRASAPLDRPEFGAVFGAALLSADRPLEQAVAFRQLAPQDLGFRVRHNDGVRVEVLIPRNTPLPATASATFYTSRADQTRMVLDIVQRSGPDGPGQSIGVHAFGPIGQPRLNYPVEVTLGYTEEGLVTVTARDPATNRAMERIMGQSGSDTTALQRSLVDSVRICS